MKKFSIKLALFFLLHLLLPYRHLPAETLMTPEETERLRQEMEYLEQASQESDVNLPAPKSDDQEKVDPFLEDKINVSASGIKREEGPGMEEIPEDIDLNALEAKTPPLQEEGNSKKRTLRLRHRLRRD